MSKLSGDEYRVLVEQAPILIWRANLRKECDYFNQRWLCFRGRSMAQEFGDGWAEGVHPDDYDRCVKTYVEAFDRRESFEMEYRLMRADGVYRWILDRGAPFYVDTGEFGGYIGSCIDVTDRVQAENAAVRRRLADIRELEALLPMCAYCRKVRDEHGDWTQVEEYVSGHTLIEFSHGICPDCAVKEL